MKMKLNHFIEFFTQSLNNSFFKTGNIGLRDSQQIRDILLCFFFIPRNTPTQADSRNGCSCVELELKSYRGHFGRSRALRVDECVLRLAFDSFKQTNRLHTQWDVRI